MDLSKIRSISNSYQDVRLLSLKDWKRAADVEPRRVEFSFGTASEVMQLMDSLPAKVRLVHSSDQLEVLEDPESEQYDLNEAVLAARQSQHELEFS
jgi:hypothetical protein